jgi:Domain of unknown function (DUF6089)
MNKLTLITRNAFLSVFFLFAQSIVIAQSRLEVGGLVGGSAYQGDILGGTVSEIAPNIHGSASVQAAYFFNDYIGVRLGAGMGKMSGSDKFAESPWRKERNLSFESNVTQFGARIEYNITGFNPAMDKNFTIFPFVGYHHLFFNPMAEYKGKLYELQPLGTAGQGLAKYPERKPYKLNTGSICFGGGMRVAIVEQLSLGLEFSAFRTFTDYLDDVAGYYVPYTDILQETGNQVAAALSNREGEYKGSDQIVLKKTTDGRGNLKVFDYYYQFGITVMYNFYDPFGQKAKTGFGKKKKTRNCPKF